MEPAEPRKVGFRLRVSAILTNATNLQKVTQKSEKELQNQLKNEPLGPKRPSGDLLKNELKTETEKNVPGRVQGPISPHGGEVGLMNPQNPHACLYIY